GDLRHTRNALLDFHRSRNEDGMLKSCYPLRYNFYHSSYSLVYVDMVWDYFQRSQDTAFVRRLLPGIEQTLSYFDAHFDKDRGYLGDIPFKPFVDWYNDGGQGGLAPGSDATRSVPYTLQYAHALQSARRLWRALGEDSLQATEWLVRLELIRTKVRLSAYDHQRKLLAERPDKSYFDQHSNLLGILTDVIPADEQAAVAERLLREEGLGQATYYFRYYLHRALLKTGRTNLVREALAPWYDIVADGATTAVERFEGSKATRSEAHPWGASPVLFAFQNLAGIDLDRKTETIVMAPRFGHLREMRGFCPVYGPEDGVWFDLRLAGGEITGSVRAGNTPVSLFIAGKEFFVAAGEMIEI
ncbi:MAG: hypothetical protein AAFN92_01895, partial [Bacteroidota bacterium]